MTQTLTALLLTALATGLAGSAHCIGMCGGIGAGLGLGNRQRHLILYHHGGRILSYSLLGLILGLILPLLGLRPALPQHALALRVLTAIIILATGIFLLFNLQPLRRLEKHAYRLWRPIAALTRHFIPARTASDAFILGLLWGLLPCGLIYSALALALSTAQPLAAALVMFTFGIGTLPAMLALSYFSSTFSAFLNRRILALIIIASGIWTLLPVMQSLHHG
ncbi:MAG: sulfite exporter TauE/SafE family protein [Cardiobacteriaceae bacterium]|nr:sulfite exporter TauE/SafE family protein [Cardiobacteriaceae bacterium]